MQRRRERKPKTYYLGVSQISHDLFFTGFASKATWMEAGVAVYLICDMDHVSYGISQLVTVRQPSQYKA